MKIYEVTFTVLTYLLFIVFSEVSIASTVKCSHLFDQSSKLSIESLMSSLLADREQSISRRSFEKNDIIDLRIPNKQLSLKNILNEHDGAEKIIEIINNHGSWPAQVIKQNNSTIELEINYSEFGISKLLLISVPSDWVYATYTGNMKIVSNRIDLLTKAIHPEFNLNESIRYRDPSDGQMKPGKIVNKNSDAFQIYSHELGSTVTVNKDEIFKLVSGRRPEKDIIRFEGQHFPQFHKIPTGIYRQFLNGAALLLSHPDAKLLTEVEAAKLLMDYLKQFMGWNWAGDKMHAIGFPYADDRVLSSLAICAQLPVLYGALLSEAGIQYRFVINTVQNHAYLEVDLVVDGEIKTFIAEPSTPNGDLESFDSMYFNTHPWYRTYNGPRDYYHPKFDFEL